MLHSGDLITRFDGATIDGREVPYDQLWQHRNVVLFVLSADLGAAASPYLRALDGRLSALKPPDTSLVVSDHTVDGLPQNSVAIADRWGEIVHIEQLASDQEAWPSIDDILEWVEFIRVKCPECPP
jgi:hypothetical protein